MVPNLYEQRKSRLSGMGEVFNIDELCMLMQGGVLTCTKKLFEHFQTINSDVDVQQPSPNAGFTLYSFDDDFNITQPTASLPISPASLHFSITKQRDFIQNVLRIFKCRVDDFQLQGWSSFLTGQSVLLELSHLLGVDAVFQNGNENGLGEIIINRTCPKLIAVRMDIAGNVETETHITNDFPYRLTFNNNAGLNKALAVVLPKRVLVVSPNDPAYANVLGKSNFFQVIQAQQNMLIKK